MFLTIQNNTHKIESIPLNFVLHLETGYSFYLNFAELSDLS